MKEKRYILVWWNNMEEPQELSFDEFKEFVYEDNQEDKEPLVWWNSKLNKNVSVNDMGNGLITYHDLNSEAYKGWVIIEL